MRMAAIHQKDTPAVGVPIIRPSAGKSILALVAGLTLVAGTVVAARMAAQRVQELMTAGDAAPLEGAQASFADLLDGLRKQTLAEARMLVDDTRIRSTVITPRFDEATVRDVLEDLRAASQATGLAVLDSTGKPQAVSGMPALSGVDLSSSAAVRTAQDRPSVDIWTVGQQVLVVALAPVRNRREVPALLLVANELPAAALAGIAKAHRVSGALVIAEKLAARTPGDGAPEAALQAAVAQAGAAGEVTRGRADAIATAPASRRRGHRGPGAVAVVQPASGGRRRSGAQPGVDAGGAGGVALAAAGGRGSSAGSSLKTQGRSIVRVTMRMSVLGIAVVLAGAALGGARSYADDKADARIRRTWTTCARSCARLKAQLQALRATLAEAAELDRQKAALFAKGAKLSGALPVESYAPRAEAAPAPDARPAARSGGGGAPSLPTKKEKVASTTGVLRGKVQLPAGEPVAYVYVENVFAPAVRGEKVKIEQVRKQFVPSWAVIQRGTTVEFPNIDNIYHNVFSQSSGNSFDLGLYNCSSAAKTHTFNEPGSVDIFCNIHPQMAASVLVVPNRHFAKVKPNGEFEIADVPAGKRKVVAWAPGSRLHVQWVEVDAGGPVDIAFRLEPKSGGHKNKNGQLYGSYQ